MPAVDDVTEAQFPIPQSDDALTFQLGVQALAEGAINDRIRFLRILEHEREIVDFEILDLRSQNAGVENGHIDDAALQRRNGLQVATQLTARKHLDFDLIARFGGDSLGQLLRADFHRMSLGILNAQLQTALFDLGLYGVHGQHRDYRIQHVDTFRAADGGAQLDDLILSDCDGIATFTDGASGKDERDRASLCLDYFARLHHAGGIGNARKEIDPLFDQIRLFGKNGRQFALNRGLIRANQRRADQRFLVWIQGFPFKNKRSCNVMVNSLSGMATRRHSLQNSANELFF